MRIFSSVCNAVWYIVVCGNELTFALIFMANECDKLPVRITNYAYLVFTLRRFLDMTHARIICHSVAFWFVFGFYLLEYCRIYAFIK